MSEQIRTDILEYLDAAKPAPHNAVWLEKAFRHDGETVTAVGILAELQYLADKGLVAKERAFSGELLWRITAQGTDELRALYGR